MLNYCYHQWWMKMRMNGHMQNFPLRSANNKIKQNQKTSQEITTLLHIKIIAKKFRNCIVTNEHK